MAPHIAASTAKKRKPRQIIMADTSKLSGVMFDQMPSGKMPCKKLSSPEMRPVSQLLVSKIAIITNICPMDASSMASVFPTTSAIGRTDVSKYSTTRVDLSTTMEEATCELAIVLTSITTKARP